MKKEKKISAVGISIRLFKIVFDNYPIYTIFVLGIGVFHGSASALKTKFTQLFFDSVERGINGNESLKGIIIFGLLMGGIVLAAEILNGLHNFLGDDFGVRFTGAVQKKMNRKSGKLNILKFEDPEILDQIKKAQEGTVVCMWFVITTVSLVTFYLPYFSVMFIYLYNLRPILAFSLIIVFVPVIVTQVLRVKLFSNLADESAPIKREFEYYERCITDKEYFKETRILGGVTYFKRLYKSSIKLLNKKIWKTGSKAELMEMGMKVLTLMGYMGVLALLVDSLLKNYIGVGAFAAVFGSLNRMFSIVEEIICMHIGNLTMSIGSVRKLLEFLDMEEREGEEEISSDIPGIKVVDASFKYPGAEKEALKNINLDIKPGETIAIVGQNGSGKTTIVKMLTGLYIPSKGKVYYGGKETSKIKPESLYGNISSVFQKFQKYKMILGENISISSTTAGEEVAVDKLDRAVDEADLTVHMDRFTDGYDTMLSREFDGIDLSGGQWQRVAISRGFYKMHNTLILDEPTAAIDPIEETKLYNKFEEMSRGKTAIIVTHRIGSARIADRIVVMENGSISQIGSHNKLLQEEGLYKEMYNAQSKWYDNVAVE